ncbi:MAG: NADH-quinone oxidoreductase subunit L [Gammaproteobacteria bacterium]|nr:MAG: NADH-quinone oxidoreductase subunit L [Gammaproteobacteria bacterium]
MYSIYLWTVLSPLIGAIVAGLFGRVIGRAGAHWVTIIGVAIATVLSFLAFKQVVWDGGAGFNGTVYVWGIVGDLRLEIGFLIDKLSATMMLVVSFVSLMIHIYTIGYMADDPGYQRFFSYISLFTFSMLMLVMSNNFFQLFFGWEAVGVVSYLLIGFWYQRESAIFANLKAFLVNRVGDFGFILGIAAVLLYFDSLDYATVFERAPEVAGTTVEVLPGFEWSVMTLIAILLFIGAMGKSAQFPLHVWLPDSMEGPTPISALIHAATMVTAGIFMVARMSPLFELSATALTMVMWIGAITALFMGVLALVQKDVKRVIAYSTLSQLGYMTVALGVSAYAAGIFHLATHAFFKALLFLAAGSVIIALHHEQDMRKMGGLWKYMPITWLTSLIGTLALVGFPGFSGFFSKDAIIEAASLSNLPGAGVVYLMVLGSVLITSLYSFRLFFLVFHGKERMDAHTREHVHETPAVVTVPLMVLAIGSVIIGWFFAVPVLFEGYFGSSILVEPGNDVLAEMAKDYPGTWQYFVEGFFHWPFFLIVAGFITTWYMYVKRPELPGRLADRTRVVYEILVRKYGFDELYQFLFAGGARQIGGLLWRVGDEGLIDGLMVNGTARAVGWFSGIARRIQSGFLYDYAFAMIIGLLVLMSLALYIYS